MHGQSDQYVRMHGQSARLDLDENVFCVSLDNRLNRMWLDPLDSFNAYIRGTLRENVITQIGKEPGSFPDPEKNGSVSQYMIVQAIGWVLCIVLAFPLTYPTLLQMLKCALSSGCPGPVQRFLAFLCCPLAYVYCYICGSFIWASLVSLVQTYSPLQLLVFILIMTLLVAQA
ncbi:unnamed protein product, partial [Effrenium voratum]